MKQLSVVFVIALVSRWSVSMACDCPRGSPESHFKAADLVFIARAEKPKTGRKSTQRLVVLHALKGKPGRSFTITRPGAVISNCDRTFREGEVDLVFVVKDKVEMCHGNYGMKWQWQQKQIPPLLRLAHGEPKAPTQTAFRAALSAALGPLVKGRTSVPVKYRPWTGKTLKVGKTTFSFTKTFPKSVVAVRDAVRHGPLHYISGIYHLQGHAFAVLLLDRGGKPQVVYQVGEKVPPARTSRGPAIPVLPPP
jgi:hypothetical protein